MILYCVGNNQFLIKGNENFASQKNKREKEKFETFDSQSFYDSFYK